MREYLANVVPYEIATDPFQIYPFFFYASASWEDLLRYNLRQKTQFTFIRKT